MIMNSYKKITDEEVQQYLELSDPIENYYIRQIGDDDSSGLLAVITNGVAYHIMDDNDERAEICINFLRRHGAPILKTVEEEDSYVKEFKSRSLES